MGGRAAYVRRRGKSARGLAHSKTLSRGSGGARGLAPKVRTGGVRLEELVMKEIKRRRRQHSREYRRKAVELLLTGKTLAELAADLGIAQSTLISWKEKYLVEMAEEPRDAREISPVVLAQKYEQLLKDHEKLKRQQEILKKALGILSETRLESMP
jgi:transposase-like protein